MRKALSFSNEVAMLEAACAWEDAVYNLTRPVKSLRVPVNDEQRWWQPRSPAMAAGLTDHIWTIKELLMMVVAPGPSQSASRACVGSSTCVAPDCPLAPPGVVAS